MLVVTKNRTLPFSKASPKPPQKWAKTFSYYRTHQRTRELLRLEGQRRQHSCLCHPPTHLVLFLVTASISPSLQAYAELHALFSYTPLIGEKEGGEGRGGGGEKGTGLHKSCNLLLHNSLTIDYKIRLNGPTSRALWGGGGRGGEGGGGGG